MKIKTFEFNPLGVNTYVLSDETNECVVIDATCFYTDEKELLLHYILDNDLVVEELINTHMHFDHIFGVNLLASQFNVKFAAHRGDEFLLDDIQTHLQMFGLGRTNTDYKPVIDRYLEEGDIIPLVIKRLWYCMCLGILPVVSFLSREGWCSIQW